MSGESALFHIALAAPLLQQEGESGSSFGPFIGVLSVIALVFLNGFFVATEFSMVTARRSRIEQLAAEGQRPAAAASRAIRQLDRVIAGTQLGITIASLGLGWVGEPAVADLLAPVFEMLPLPEEWHGAGTHTIAFIVSFSLITALHILLGELVPKAMALQKAEAVAMVVAIPMVAFMTLLGPAVRLLSGIGNIILGWLGVRSAGEEAVHSIEDLRYLVTASRKAGILEPAEELIATRAFSLGDLTARRVMIPRTELVSVRADISLAEFLQLVAREHHVRFPVYERDVDHAIGILYLTDVVGWQRHNSNEAFSAREVMREALLVPESLEGDRLLVQMRKARTHIALVVDEFGGVAGMVTLQDLVERIVGVVPDEVEGEPPEVSTLPDGSTVISGLMSVAELGERLDIPLQVHESETVGGYIMEMLGRVPDEGEEILFEGYRMRIDAMDGPRIAQVVLSRP